MPTEKRVTLLELDIDNSAVIKKQGDLLKQINELKKANQGLKKDTENLTKATDEQASAYAKNEAEIKVLSQDSRTYSKILQDQNREQETGIKTITKTNGSINSLRNALNVNKTAYKALTKEQRENVNVGGALQNTINAQDEQYKELSRSIGNNQVDVGNYKLATDELLGSFNIMGVNLGQVVQGLKAKEVALKSTVKGLSGASKGLKLFRIALISTGIGAIVVVLGSLIAAFASTQSGMDSVRRAVAPLVGAFKGLIGVVQEISKNVFGGFGDEFSKQKDIIVAGILGVRIAFNKLSGDVENANKLTKQLEAVASNLEQTQARINVRSGKLSDIYGEAGKKIREASRAQEKIVELSIEAEEAEIKNITLKSELIAKQKEQNKIAEDQTKPLAERLAGAEESIRLAQQQEAIELNLLKIKIEQKDLELSQNDSDREALKERAELQAEIGAVQARITEFETTQQNKVNTIRQQVISKQKQAQAERLKALKDELDLSQRIAEQGIELLGQELDLFLANNQTKLKDGEAITSELLKQEEERLSEALNIQKQTNQEVLEVERQSIQDQLRLKEIGQEEANNQFTLIQNDFRLSELEAENAFNQQLLDNKQAFKDQEFEIEKEQALKQNQLEEQKKNEKIQAFQDELIRLQLEGEEQAIIDKAKLDLDRQKAIEQAILVGADVEKVTIQFAEKEKAIDKAVKDAKINQALGALSAVKGALNEESDAFKAVAITEALINTYLGASRAFSDYVYPLSLVVAGATVASGLATVSKIAGFAEGTESAQPYTVTDLSNHTGIITGQPNIRRSNGDNMLATVKTGEAILNEKQQSKINNLLGFDAVRYAVKGYADGSTFTSPTVTNTINRNIVNNSTANDNTLENNVTLEVDVKDIVKETGLLNSRITDATI